MAVTFSNTGTLAGQAGGANRAGNVTIPANTKAFYVFVYPDASNTTGLTSDPSVITLNGVTMTLVSAVPSQASAPYGNCQHVYKVENPPIGTFSLSVTHAQWFYTTYVSVVTTTPLIPPVGAFNYTTSSTPSCTVGSSNGNNSLFSVVADATDSAAGFVDGSGTLTRLTFDGGTGRCGYSLYRRSSTGSSNAASWTIPLSEQWSAIAINFSDDIYIVDTVTDTIDPSGTLTYTTSGFSSITGITTNIAGVTVGSISDTAGDGTAVVSSFVEGGLYPILPTAVSYTFTDGSNNAAKNGNISVPAGYTKLVIGTPLFAANTIPNAIFSATGRVIATSDIFLHTSYGDLIITDDGDWNATDAGSFDLWLRVAAGADAGKMYNYTVTITESGAVVVTGGLTSSGLASSGLTASGLTSIGL